MGVEFTCSVSQCPEMSLLLTDFNQWYTNFSAVSPKQQYDLLMAELSQPIAFEDAMEIDLAGVVLDLYEPLISHNLIDQALALMHSLQQQHLELYQREFQYFDDFLNPVPSVPRRPGSGPSEPQPLQSQAGAEH